MGLCIRLDSSTGGKVKCVLICGRVLQTAVGLIMDKMREHLGEGVQSDELFRQQSSVLDGDETRARVYFG